MRLNQALALLLLLASTLAAQASYSIRGVIEDAHGKPVAAAMLTLSGMYNTFTQTTGGLGTFEFIVTHTGPFQLTVRPPYGTQESFEISYRAQPIVIHLQWSALSPSSKTASKSAQITVDELEASPKARSELVRAQKALQKSDYSKAAKYADAALHEAPDWSQAHLMRGVIALDTHDDTTAAKSFALAIQYDPNNAMALTEMGRLDAERKQTSQADQYLRRALKIPPVQWLTYLEMANVDMAEQNYSEAKSMATKAEACQPPPPPQAWFVAGIADFYQRQYRAAQSDFKQYLSKAPNTPAFAKARAGAEGNLKVIAKLLAQP